MKYFKDIPERYYYNKNSVKQLGEVFSSIGLHKKRRRSKLINDEIQKIWEEFVDDSLKEHGNIANLRNGILYIEIDSHPWLHHFTNFCKQDLLCLFQKETTKTFISDIKFKLTSSS